MMPQESHCVCVVLAVMPARDDYIPIVQPTERQPTMSTAQRLHTHLPLLMIA